MPLTSLAHLCCLCCRPASPQRPVWGGNPVLLFTFLCFTSLCLFSSLCYQIPSPLCLLLYALSLSSAISINHDRGKRGRRNPLGFQFCLSPWFRGVGSSALLSPIEGEGALPNPQGLIPWGVHMLMLGVPPPSQCLASVPSIPAVPEEFWCDAQLVSAKCWSMCSTMCSGAGERLVFNKYSH